jgi:ketosteroid isomerase-like protein
MHLGGDSTMKLYGLGLALLLLLSTAATSQNKPAPNDDQSAIRATVTDYIEAYYTGDAHRMAQTLHPHYLKHMIHGDIPMREFSGPQMVREVRSNGPANFSQAEKTERVEVLDVAGDMASAKLVTPHWVDYITLTKLDGTWKILSVVQWIHD